MSTHYVFLIMLTVYIAPNLSSTARLYFAAACLALATLTYSLEKLS